MINHCKLLAFLFICIVSSHCAANTEEKTPCDKWIVDAVHNIQSVPPNKRFKRALEQLQHACEAIPVTLKQAATDSLKATSVKQRFNILLQAAAPYYQDACRDIAAGRPAQELFEFCQGDDYPDGPFGAMLTHVDAATYLYGKAVEKELKKAGIDKHYSKLFILNYFLGAGLAFEDQKPRL
jgi:hypothetical protein